MIKKKLLKMSEKEILKELEKAIKELSDTVFDVRCVKDKDYSQIKHLKKEVAQLYTLLNNKKILNSKKVRKPVKEVIKQKKDVKEENISKDIDKKSGIKNKIHKNKLR
jgi:ribosomal protein L29